MNGERSITQIESIYEPVEDALVRVEQAIRRAGHVDSFASLAEMLDYILDWPGKHVRPALTLLSSKFYDKDIDRVIPMAAAVEMLHVATLIHDDTVDSAKLRRGRATLSSIWGKDVAVLVGDYIFAKSASIACETGNMRVMQLFAETVMALSSGELRELIACNRWEPSRDHYWKRIKEKTASLFATATESGAILSGAPEYQIQALREYGFKLGMAFQIIDDILDYEGSEDVVGKPVGNDLSQGVLTLPAILLAERYPHETSIRVAFDNRADPVKVRAAVEVIRNSAIIKDAFTIAEGFCEDARQALRDLPDVPARRSLVSLTDYVTRRNK